MVGKRDVSDHWMLLHFLMAKEADEGSGRAGCGLLLDTDLVGGHTTGWQLEGQPSIVWGSEPWTGPQTLFLTKSDKMHFFLRNLEEFFLRNVAGWCFRL